MATAGAEPLVRNADFTDTLQDDATTPVIWQMPKGVGWTVTNEDGMSGQFSLRYTAAGELPAPPVVQIAVCQPNTDYVLTAGLKSDGKLQPLVIVRDAKVNENVLAKIVGTTAGVVWKRYLIKFNSGAATSLRIELWADARHAEKANSPLGSSSFDDVQIRPAAEAADAEATAKTGQYENIARGKPYQMKPSPNYGYCTDPGDRTQLTDGVYTVGYFWTQKTTVGWVRARPVIITIDLGKVEPIRGVSFNTAAGVAGVTWPMSVAVLVSDEGNTYHVVGDLVSLSVERESPPADRYAVYRYWTDTLKTHGRYVQLVIDPAGPYCFTDEVEVYRGEDAWVALPLGGETSAGGEDYFKKFSVNNGVKARLFADLRAVRSVVSSSGLEKEKLAPLLQELEAIEKEIPQLPRVTPEGFKAVFPLNELHTRIYAVNGRLRQLQGRPMVEAWVNHPLDYLAPLDAPGAQSRKEISVHTMQGEWRSAVLNLTSGSDKPIKATLRLEGLPGGANPPHVSVHRVEWTDTKEQQPIGVALPPIAKSDEGYAVEIPAGMTRQVWFSINAATLPAGSYSGRVIVGYAGGGELKIPFSLRVFPLKFPARPTLHVGGWDYTNHDQMYGVTPQNRQALIRHLQERFVDSPWATAAALPFGTFDAEGNHKIKPDTSNLDAWINTWPAARRYCVFAAVGDNIAGARIGTPEFSARVKTWINFWVDHLGEKGIKPEQLVILLVDEPHRREQDEVITAWAKAIKEAQPKVTLWEDPTYVNPQEMTAAMPAAVDVLCPNRVHLLTQGREFEQFYRKQKEAGKRLDFYSCSGPMHLLDPYSYVRLQAWTCWDMGAEGTFFWALGDTGGGDPWNPYASPGTNYAPMFLGPDSVTPGKHMEALRESAEDFEYFVMLREAVARARPNHPMLTRAKELLASGARRVLQAENADKISWLDGKDRWIAEQVRLEILETLAALKK